MVSTVRSGGVSMREVLDTTESDISDTAEHIRSYHSVLLVPDSRTGAAPLHLLHRWHAGTQYMRIVPRSLAVAVHGSQALLLPAQQRPTRGACAVPISPRDLRLVKKASAMSQKSVLADCCTGYPRPECLAKPASG